MYGRKILKAIKNNFWGQIIWNKVQSWHRCGLVGKHSGLVIERLQNLGSNSESLYPWERNLMLLTRMTHLGAKQLTRCGGPAWWKTCKQNSFRVRVV